MNVKLLFIVLYLGCLSQTSRAQIEKLLPGNYWQYSTTTYNKDGKHVYNFTRIASADSIKEVAMRFADNGTFKEVVNKNHPKPARSGKWKTSKDTLILDFPNQRWNYKILFMNSKEFQCTMSKG